jgi:hypothetical protein
MGEPDFYKAFAEHRRRQKERCEQYEAAVKAADELANDVGAASSVLANAPTPSPPIGKVRKKPDG